MASKVLVPTSPFAKLQVKKSPPEAASSGFFVGSDAGARVAHLEHSVRFLQEQHRQMLSGLHAEIEALRERNRDLQFQLIFNKDSAPKSSATVGDEPAEINEEVQSLRVDVCRLEREAAAARGEARAAEARALQLQKQLDALTEYCNFYIQSKSLQCMKNSLQASVRAGALDSFGFQNTYHFPPMQDFWVDTLADEMPRGGRRRPLALPELVPHRATIFANTHARGRSYGYEKSKKTTVTNGDTVNGKPTEEHHEQTRLKELSIDNLSKKKDKTKVDSMVTYPELKIVVTKIIPHGKGPAGEARPRPRRHHRKHTTDHT
ncbi:Coiled-coil domain-containing protein 74B [Papilio machaon]|uniref:Coiled-coil domain-containing protein 74B n=1 Tax=Papilio machaon TaxID=76193 RepID=A0A194QLQ6_PAPMA|nr:Coiled-coil domain-containing protein 74B [Papilio machaon]